MEAAEIVKNNENPLYSKGMARSPVLKHDHTTVDLAALYSEREEFYRTVLDSLADGVIITDGDDRILYANARMEPLSGYSRQELTGRIGYELLSLEKNWLRMRKRIRERLTGSAENYEIELRRKDGSTGWVRVSAVPYRNAAGKIVGSIGTISCIERQKTLERENEYLRDELQSGHETEELIGPSPCLARIRSQIAMVAPTGASVLITGESGTGKELVARAIHRLSTRASQPMVRVNCAAIPKDLFESEFFGHARGSFTGAIKDRTGRFELAHGGTLFLDEVGEIPLDLQGKLLRVIQEGTFERVGEDRTRTADVRLVAATNRDLAAESTAGRFRLDLYYRLSVFPIEVPPLRARREDIVPLARHFLAAAARGVGIRPPELTKAHVQELERYPWPGNVRELQNVMERATILAAHGPFALPIQAAGRTPLPPVSNTHPPAAALQSLKDSERDMIASALRQARGKLYGANGAAAILGVKPTTLASKMARLGLTREQFLHS